MYSYEDRLRAVHLYLKVGKRVGLTIRELGYPNMVTLKAWCREFEQNQCLSSGYTRARKYTDAHKEKAVQHYLENGRCLAATIRALGFPSKMLMSAWVRERCPESRVRRNGTFSKPALDLSPAFKQSAVIALCTRQTSAASLARELGVSRPTLYNWKHQLLGPDAPTPMKRKQHLPSDAERSELEQEVDTLRREVRRLQLEQDLLKKANELLKKDLGIDRRLLTNREKTQLVDALRSKYTLGGLLLEAGLPRSSYFYHRARLGVADKYLEVWRAMTDLFESNYRCYGYRRLHASLTKQSLKISEKVVRRLMKQESLIPTAPKRRLYGWYMGEISPAPDNLLNRDFTATVPNEKWLTDITEFQIPAGKVYLSPMIDCLDGMVVSWSISTRPDAELVNGMLDAAIRTVSASGPRPVVHSDRGGHYRWPGWMSRISDAKLSRSMSRKACSPDNAACEGFFGRLKNELFYPRNWVYATVDDFVAALDSYIRWYNEERIKISLGARSPTEHRRELGIAV